MNCAHDGLWMILTEWLLFISGLIVYDFVPKPIKIQTELFRRFSRNYLSPCPFTFVVCLSLWLYIIFLSFFPPLLPYLQNIASFAQQTIDLTFSKQAELCMLAHCECMHLCDWVRQQNDQKHRYRYNDITSQNERTWSFIVELLSLTMSSELPLFLLAMLCVCLRTTTK